MTLAMVAIYHHIGLNNLVYEHLLTSMWKYWRIIIINYKENIMSVVVLPDGTILLPTEDPRY